MIISIATLFPDLHSAFTRSSLLGRASEKGILEFNILNMLSVCPPKERVDGPTYGHHAGMILRPEVIERSVYALEEKHGPALRVFFSPRGTLFTQRVAQDLAQKIQKKGHVAFIAGRYEGIDARAEETYADLILSLGDFVVMGGDIPAQLVIEACTRYIPGIVGNNESVERDSFTGPFVDSPAYTAPATWNGKTVPEVLRSGDHRKIEEWSLDQSVKKSVTYHFSWVRSSPVTTQERTLIREAIPRHYVALMHDDVLLPQDKVGTSSVTSIDIHDIARSSRTYNVKGFFLVTPLHDQQMIVQTLLDFWQTGDGVTYNPHRKEALATTHLSSSLDHVIATITELEGVAPLLIATSAQSINHVPSITYQDQQIIWQQQKPILIVLGTARGLAPQTYEKVHYALVPLEGYSDFNHLSVRSAAAIIFDRWLGMQPKIIQRTMTFSEK